MSAKQKLKQVRIQNNQKSGHIQRSLSPKQLPIGIQRPYKKSSKHRILPILPTTVNQITSTYVPKQKQSMPHVQSQIQLQMYNKNKSLQKSNSFSEVSHFLNKKQLQSRLLQNHNNLSKHFQQHLNYQYESIHPNLENVEEKNQLMRKQSIYIYIRKYLNAAYGEGQLPKMKMRNKNRYEYHNKSRLDGNINAPKNNGNVSRFSDHNNKIRQQNIKDRIKSNHTKTSNNNHLADLKKDQFSKSYLNRKLSSENSLQYGKKGSFRTKVKKVSKQKEGSIQYIQEYASQNPQNIEPNSNMITNTEQDTVQIGQAQIDEQMAKLTVQLSQKIAQQQIQQKQQQKQKKQQKKQQQNQIKLEDIAIIKKQVQLLPIIQQIITQTKVVPLAQFLNIIQINQPQRDSNPIDHQKEFSSMLQDQRKFIQAQNYFSDVKLSFQKNQLKQLNQILGKESSQPSVRQTEELKVVVVQKIDVSVQMTQKDTEQRAMQCEEQFQQKIQPIIQTRQQRITCDDITFSNIPKPITKQQQISPIQINYESKQILCDISVKEEQLKQKSRQQEKQRQRQARQNKQKLQKLKRQIQREKMKHSLKDLISTVESMNGKADNIQKKFDKLKDQDLEVVQDLCKKDESIQNLIKMNEENKKSLQKISNKCNNLQKLNLKLKQIKKQQHINRMNQLKELSNSITELQLTSQKLNKQPQPQPQPQSIINHHQTAKQQVQNEKGRIVKNIFTSPISKVREYRYYQNQNNQMFPIQETIKENDQIPEEEPLQSFKNRDQHNQSNDQKDGSRQKLHKKKNNYSDKYIKISHDEFEEIQKMESYNQNIKIPNRRAFKQQNQDQITVSIHGESSDNHYRIQQQSRSNSIAITQKSQTSADLFGDYQSSIYQSKTKQNFEDTSQSNKKLQSKFTQTRKLFRQKKNANSIQSDQYIHI